MMAVVARAARGMRPDARCVRGARAYRGVRFRLLLPSSTTTHAAAGRAPRRVRKAARAASSRSAACSVFFSRPTTAGDGALQGGARHGAVGMLLVPPGDVGIERGVGRRFQAGAQHVQVVLSEAWRSARRTAWRAGRSRARLAQPAFDAGPTDGEGRGRRTAGHPLLAATTRSRRSRAYARMRTVDHRSTYLGTAIIVPSPVGVNRFRSVHERARRDCPHARGGEPDVVFLKRCVVALSPRPWG